jgi:hypothetical protein
MKTLLLVLLTGLFCCRLVKAQTAADSTTARRVTRAQFHNGRYAFDEALRQILTPYFTKTGMARYRGSGWLTLTGKVTEQGNIINLVADNEYNSEFVSGLVNRLSLLPALQPATINGKPIKERFMIAINFETGYYSFQYHFLEPLLAAY